MTDVPLSEEAALESLVAQAVDEFLERQKQGEQPDPAEYAARHPHAASVLREVLAALHVVGLSSCAGLRALGGATTNHGPVPGMLGDFRILHEIGRGGMGIVYEAEQISLGRRVALKVLPFAATLDGKHLQRFKHEAQAAGQLHHTNIVPVYAVGCERGVHFYAMQYIDGQTLAQVIADWRRQLADGPRARISELEQQPPPATPDQQPGPSSAITPTAPVAALSTVHSMQSSAFFRTVAQLGVQAAEALQYAHGEGVVHRDVKPANLLLDAKGKLWITDFGLARCRDNTGLTMSGDLVGTLRYMSPEQALAKPMQIDHRTDIYSLGVTLYELLTLQPAFSSDRQQLLQQITLEEPRSPRRLNKRIPAELETIVRKAMEKNPDDRYGSVQELAEDLNHFLENKPIRARPAHRWERAWKWARRRPALTAVYGLVLVAFALSGLGGIAICLWQRADAAHQDAVGARDEAQAALQQEQQARTGEAEARRRLATLSYLYKVRLAYHAWMDGDLGQARLLMDHCPKELRHWEWYYVDRLCHSELHTLQGHAEPVASIVYSPDGRHLVSRGQQSMRAWDLATNHETFTFRATEGVNFTVSSDGKQFASWNAVGAGQDGRSVASEIKVSDLAAGQQRFTLKVPGARVANAVFSPDGNYLAAWNNIHDAQQAGPRTLGAEIKVWDLATRQETRTLKIEGSCVYRAAFSPDSKRLAVQSFVRAVPRTPILPGEIKVWDLTTGQEILALKAHILGMECAFGSDGKLLASPTGDNSVRVWNLDTRQDAVTLKCQSFPSHVAFSPDGGSLACFSEDGTLQLWDMATGKPVRTVKGPAAAFSGAAFSPDSKRLAGWGSQDKAIRVWDLATGQEVLRLQGHTEAVTCAAFNADGRRLATSSVDQTIKVWDTTTAPEPQTLRVAHEFFGASGVAYSPDSRRLATAGRDKRIKVWDAATGQELFQLQGDSPGYWSVAFSPDGRHLASAAFDDSHAGTVRVWDVITHREIITLKGHTAYVSGVAYSPDGSRLATAGSADRTVKVWDATTGRELLTLGGYTKAVYSVTFSPDGRLMATASDENAVKVWDLATGRVALTLQGHTNAVRGVAFSPDGQLLASASMDSTVRLWKLATGLEVGTFQGHTSGVRDVAFSPDGQRLASGSQGEMVKIWDVLTGEEAITLRTGGVTCLAFSPDGRQLAAAECEGTAKLWRAPSSPDRLRPAAAISERP